ncbi:MAG: (Fe-S)-binding protein [Pseudomonadota bacterium]
MEAIAVMDPAPRRVCFFATCLVDGLLPQVGRASLAVLKSQGLSVDIPPAQVCCGQSLYKAGHAAQAARVAAAWVRAFRGAEVVVSPSGSCVAHVRHTLAGLLADQPELAAEAARLAGVTFELSQFLYRVLGAPALAGHAPHRPWTYHPSCGLHRSLGEDEAPRVLLAALPGPPALELPRAPKCCGFGGPFSVSHPELSAAMLADKLQAARESGAQVLVVGDVGCMLHLGCGVAERGGGLEVAHLSQVLAGEVS